MLRVKTISGILLLVLISSSALAQDEVPSASPVQGLKFNCTRKVTPCVEMQGTCDMTTGLCACEEGFGATRCEMTIDSAAPGCAPDNCGENGECISGKCICNEFAFGEACEKKRVAVSCTPQGLTITVAPSFSDTPYIGHLMVMGVDRTMPCNIAASERQNADADSEDLKYFEVEFGFNGCGNAFMEENEEGYPEYFFDVVVAYHPTLVRSSDHLFSAKCRLPNPDNPEMEMRSKLSLNPREGQQEVIDEVEAVSLTIKDDDDEVVVGQQRVVIGQLLRLVYADKHSSKRFNVIQVVANDGREDGDTYTLIEDSAIVADVLVPVEIECGADSNTITLVVEVFGFAFSNQVNFKTIYQVCSDENCARMICGEPELALIDTGEDTDGMTEEGDNETPGDAGTSDNAGPPGGPPAGAGPPDNTPDNGAAGGARKRRAVRDGKTEYQELDASIMIAFPQSGFTDSLERSGSGSGQELVEDIPECGRSIVLIILIGVLAILLTVSTAAAMILFVRMRLKSLKQVTWAHPRRDNLRKIDYNNHFRP